MIFIAVLGILFSGCLGPSVKVYSVRGTVRDGEGNVVPGVEILASFGDSTDQVSTDDLGQFCFEQLSGSAEITVEGQVGVRVIPASYELSSKKTGADFTLHAIYDYDQPVSLPQSRMIFFENLALDFSETDLESAQQITVRESTLAALGEMEAAGPALEIELEEEFEGKVTLTLAAESPASWLFRYDQQNELWYPLVSVSHEAGQLKAELSHFSSYGVFKAPRATAPRANRDPGAYPGGSKVELLGDLIYYTTDGSEPDNFSSIFEAPVAIGAGNLNLKAVNIKANHRPSEVASFAYEVLEEAGITYISGPKFATVWGRENRLFDLDRGEITEDRSQADLELTSVQFGTEHTMIGFTNLNGVHFPAVTEDDAYLQEALADFYALGEGDWEGSELTDKFRVGAHDSLIIKTKAGRLARLFVVATRGHWHHNDRPAIDFAYQFLDEVDLEPPVLESITLKMEDGEEITKTLEEGIVEFVFSGVPEVLIFNFDELVYSSARGLMESYGNTYLSYALWVDAYPYYYNRATSLSKQQSIATYIYDMWDSYEFMGGDPDFWADKLDEDPGYHFSDLAGNRMFELPFEKIVLIRAEQ